MHSRLRLCRQGSWESAEKQNPAMKHLASPLPDPETQRFYLLKTVLYLWHYIEAQMLHYLRKQYRFADSWYMPTGALFPAGVRDMCPVIPFPPPLV